MWMKDEIKITVKVQEARAQASKLSAQAQYAIGGRGLISMEKTTESVWQEMRQPLPLVADRGKEQDITAADGPGAILQRGQTAAAAQGARQQIAASQPPAIGLPQL